jgi:hypothetical protein
MRSDVAELKRVHRATWAAGDYAAVAAVIDRVPPRDLLDRVGVEPSCRPGGRIGLVNWTPAGQVGELFRIMGRYLPAPPSFASPPPLWGDEAHVRGLFEGGVELEFARGHNPWRFPSAEHYVAFMETNYGPTVKARERLSAEGRWEECRAEILAMAERRNEDPAAGLLMRAEYLVVVGHRS